MGRRSVAPFVVVSVVSFVAVVAAVVIIILANSPKSTSPPGGGSSNSATNMVSAQCPNLTGPGLKHGFKSCTDPGFNKPSFQLGTDDDPAHFSGKCCMFANSAWDTAPDKVAANKKLNEAYNLFTSVLSFLDMPVPFGDVIDGLVNDIIMGIPDPSLSVQCGHTPPASFTKLGLTGPGIYVDTVSGNVAAYTSNDGCPLVFADPKVAAFMTDLDWIGQGQGDGGIGYGPCNVNSGAVGIVGQCGMHPSSFANYNPYGAMKCTQLAGTTTSTRGTVTGTTGTGTFTCTREGPNVNSTPAYRTPPMTQAQLTAAGYCQDYKGSWAMCAASPGGQNLTPAQQNVANLNPNSHTTTPGDASKNSTLARRVKAPVVRKVQQQSKAQSATRIVKKKKL